MMRSKFCMNASSSRRPTNHGAARPLSGRTGLPCSQATIFWFLSANSSGKFLRLHPTMEAKDRDDWQAWLREIRALQSGVSASDKLIAFAVRSQDPPSDKTWPGHFTLSLNKFAVRFPNNLRDTVAALGRAILRLELLGRLERSRALHSLLARFEGRYQMQVRDNGQLTFLDVSGLLASEANRCWGAKSFDSLGRQEMNFRLDSSYRSLAPR